MKFYWRIILLLPVLLAVGCSDDDSNVIRYVTTLTRTIEVNAARPNFKLSPTMSSIVNSDSLFLHTSVSTFSLDEVTPALPPGRPVGKIRVTGIRTKVISTTAKFGSRVPLHFSNCNDGSCSSWVLAVFPIAGNEQAIDFKYADQLDIGKALHNEKSLDMRLGFSYQRNEIPTELTLEVTLNVLAEIPEE